MTPKRPSPIDMMIDAACGIVPGQHPPLQPPAQDEDGPEVAALVNTADAAKVWWAAKRPEGWTEDEHLARPDEGLSGPDAALARMVAELVRLGW